MGVRDRELLLVDPQPHGFKGDPRAPPNEGTFTRGAGGRDACVKPPLIFVPGSAAMALGSLC